MGTRRLAEYSIFFLQPIGFLCFLFRAHVCTKWRHVGRRTAEITRTVCATDVHSKWTFLSVTGPSSFEAIAVYGKTRPPARSYLINPKQDVRA